MDVQAIPNFARNLRRALERKGISQRELARKAGTKHPNVNRILQGKQTPTLDLADRLADAAGMKLADLLKSA